MVRLRKQIDYWKDQAALPSDRRAWIDLVEIADARQTGADE